MVCKDQWTTFGLYISTKIWMPSLIETLTKNLAFAAAHCSSCVSYHPIPRAHLVQWQLVSMRMMFLTSFAVTWTWWQWVFGRVRWCTKLLGFVSGLPSVPQGFRVKSAGHPLDPSTFGCSDSSVDSTNICKCHSYLRWFSYTWSEMTPSVFPIGGWASEKVKLDLGTPKTSGGVSRFHHCWHTHLAWSENKGCHGTPTFHALCIIFPYIFPRQVPLFSHWESHNSWAIPENPPKIAAMSRSSSALATGRISMTTVLS